MGFIPDKRTYDHLIKWAIREDIGPYDVTTEATVDPDRIGRAKIIAKEDIVASCLFVAKDCFLTIDPNVEFLFCAKEGQKIKKGEYILEIQAKICTILSIERIALNFLQRLCGISTFTKKVIDKVKDLPVRIVDTRKTTPCLRSLEKYAVQVGGGQNHRFSLFDGILIKDNHIAAVGSIKKAIELCKNRAHHLFKIQVEVSNNEQIKEAILAGADALLLDNMVEGKDVTRLKMAVDFARSISSSILLEASGGICLENIREVALTGVDQVSCGCLTHSAPSVDLSLRIL